MKNKGLKEFPNISKLLGNYINYANMMKICIVGMMTSWLLIILTSVLELILNPGNTLAWTFLAVFAAMLIASRKPCGMYCEIYRTHLTKDDASTYEKDLSENEVVLSAAMPAALTKEYLYIAYRCDVTRIALEDIKDVERIVDYSKKGFAPNTILTISTSDNTEHVIPMTKCKQEDINAFLNNFAEAKYNAVSES